jgi:hypothetical protein
MAYTVEVRVLKLVARWLGEGRPSAGQSRRDIEACDAHVKMLCAIRCARAWEVVLSVRMQTWVVVGRNAWLLSTQRHAAAAHAQAQRANDAQIQVLLAVQDGYVRRIQMLDDEVATLREVEHQLQGELADVHSGRVPRMLLMAPEPELDEPM